MLIDWECARFTKPDKPLNAYDTLYKFYLELEDKILPLLKEKGLDKSGNKLDNIKQIGDKDMKVKELYNVLKEYMNNGYGYGDLEIYEDFFGAHKLERDDIEISYIDEETEEFNSNGKKILRF